MSNNNSSLNSIIGIALIGVILFIFSYYNTPEKKEGIKDQSIDTIESEKTTKNEKNVVETSYDTEDTKKTSSLLQSDSIKHQALYDKYFIFSNATNKTEKLLTINTDNFKLLFSNKSGRIAKVILTKYKTYHQKPVILFDDKFSDFNTEFTLLKNPDQNSNIKTISTKNLYFEPSTKKQTEITCKDSLKISYTLADNSGTKKIIYTYTIYNDKYLVKYNLKTKNLASSISPYTGIMLNWKVLTPSQEKIIENQQRVSTIYYKYLQEDVDYISPQKDETEELSSKLKWVCFKQQYFNTSLIFKSANFNSQDSKITTSISNIPKKLSDSYVKSMEASLNIPVVKSQENNDELLFYFGPNKHNQLKKAGDELEHIVDFGWKIFRFINLYLINWIFEFFNNLGFSIFLTILLLTISVKMLLSPILWKTYVGTAKMNVLKPEIQEINKKFKDEAVKKQQATMNLYRTSGVNPLAGCLPAIIQMPFLFALLRFFPNKFDLRQKSFLWAEDLSTYDSVLNLPISIPFYGDHVSLFALFLAVSMIFYTRINQQFSGTPSGMEGAMAKQMKVMNYIMPVIMLFFFNSAAAALSLYYFIANCITMLLQIIIKKYIIDEEKIHKKIQMNKLKPKKKSGFSQRLEKRIKEAQKVQKERKKR